MATKPDYKLNDSLASLHIYICKQMSIDVSIQSCVEWTLWQIMAFVWGKPCTGSHDQYFIYAIIIFL